MKTVRRHIAIAFALVMALSASCSKDEVRVIPRGKLAKIYAEMLVTDQWITSTPGVRMIADTSLVYEPILEKYGYTSDDYRKSIDVYMDDPERFARIFRTSSEILEKRIQDLKKEQARRMAIAAIPVVKSNFDVGEMVPYLDDEPYIHYYDSLDIVFDKELRMYIFNSVARGDTLYEGVRMIVRSDSLSVADSIAKHDSSVVDRVGIRKFKASDLKELEGGKLVGSDSLKIKE